MNKGTQAKGGVILQTEKRDRKMEKEVIENIIELIESDNKLNNTGGYLYKILSTKYPEIKRII